MVMIIMMTHGITTIPGIMKDTCTKSMIGKVLTNGKGSTIMNMSIIHTLTIHGSRKLKLALKSHDLRLTNPLLTKLHQRNQYKNQSRRERKSKLKHQLQHQLLLQNQLQSLNQKLKLHQNNQLHQRSKRRNLKNRQKSQVLLRSLLKRKRL